MTHRITDFRRVSIPELDASPVNELRQLATDSVVDGRLLVALERRAPQLAGPGGRVARPLLRPAIEVLGRGEERAVEALAEALERVGRSEEVPTCADLDVGV